ncbi:MAG: PAS domain-containing protein [Candidatus Sericytochromatia bacterium]
MELDHGYLARFIMEHLPDSTVFVFDKDCRYVLAGGDTEGAAIAGRTLWEVFPEAEAQLLTPYYQSALAGQMGRLEQRQGESCAQHNFAPVPDTSGSLAAGMHVIHQQQPGGAEQALAETELRYRLVIAGSSAGIWEWNVESDRLWFSPRFFELIGFGPSEAPHTREFWNSRVHPQDLTQAQTAFQAHLETRLPYQHEYRLKLKSGDYHWFLVTAQAHWDENGKAVRVTGSINDIHARKLLEDERELQFAVIFEQAYELMAILSPQGRIQNANRALLNLLGCSLEQIHEQFFWNLPCWKTSPEATTRLRSAIQLAGEHQDIRYEEIVEGPGRRPNVIDLSIKPVFSRRQDLLCLIVEGRDITPLKQAQQLAEKTSQMLLHHNRQLENFAHITSHNLRSPATNIHMLLSYYENAQNADEQAYALNKLHQSSQRLMETLDILSDNLAIRMDPSVPREELQFEAVLARHLEMLSAQIMETGTEVIADFSLCPSLEYPPSYLDSILTNLLSNAIKYRHPDRRPIIRLHSWLENQSVNLRISDNGLGINLERHKDKLFGLYKTFHRNPEARGVGLFLIKSQIEALGGRISVKSQPNQGTTFHIIF